MYDHDMLTKRELLTKHRNDESSMCTVVYVIVHVCIRGIEEWAMYIIDSPLPVTGGLTIMMCLESLLSMTYETDTHCLHQEVSCALNLNL